MHRQVLRKEKLEPLSHSHSQEFRTLPPPCPLDMFPSKRDTISTAFFGIETKKHTVKLQDNARWLYVDKMDADFGLQGDSQEDHIRRAYRRIESSALFSPVNKQDASLAEIVPSNVTSKRYVVVEESRLQELTKLENTLRKEKFLLGEQCGWALSDFQVNARLPIPATRMAVHSFCEQQMQKVALDVMKLKVQWETFCKQNHYNKPHMYIKDSYVKMAPVSQRAMKLRLVRSAVETWRLRKDRDSMLFEDDLSYLMGKYHEARVRQKDYERYYILAARYGCYSEEEFNKDPRPGRRYFIAASRGAIKLQLLWDRYWAMMKLRRYRACRVIQKYYRRRFYYKKYHPIINLRLKIGKKTYYIFCWHQWLHYNYLCRKIKDALNYQFNVFLKTNFLAWKKYFRELKANREQRAIQMEARSKNTIAYLRFARWVRYTKSNRKLKIRLRRLFGFPHFDLWLQHVNFQKLRKKLNNAAYHIQSVFRTLVCRKRFLRKRNAQIILRSFNKLVLCVRLVRRKRRAAVLQEFDEWSPEETQRRTNRLNDIERGRLIKRQQFVQEKEKGAIAGLKKHLNSSDGKSQLTELLKSPETARTINAKYPEKKYNTLNIEGKMKAIAKSLAEECSRVIRLLESHNYNTKHPPFLCCPDVRCNATFTTEAQYHSHLKESEPHCGQPPQFSEFHMLMRHQRGQELLRTYLTRLHGIGGCLNYLDAWYTIQEWKKLPTVGDAFETKAMNIYELYLLPDSARKLDLSFDGYAEMLDVLATVKHKEHKGLYRVARAQPGLIRGFLGVAGHDYHEFTTEGVLLPDTFLRLEWHCFMKLFTMAENDGKFLESAEYLTYQALKETDREHRHEEYVRDYEKYRLLKIQQWTRGFCDNERAMYNKATEIVEIFMKREVDTIYKKIEKESVKERVREVRHEQQRIHEGTALLTEDVYFWTEDTILDSLYEHYTTALINKMLEIPECRKGLLQYSGFLKAQSRHMHIENTPKTGKEEWFTEFYTSARKSEKGAIPLGGVKAATIIQARMRGVLGRKKAKKVFMKTYVKMFDSQANAAYYQNVRTGESSWTRPLMTHHLFKKANW